MRFVIDIDDTLSVWNENRIYKDFEPIPEMVAAVNAQYDAGHDIVLFTARGMKSMDGNIARIHKELRPVLEKWLAKHRVKYHQLLIGKPWADFYVDDKNMTMEEFKEI